MTENDSDSIRRQTAGEWLRVLLQHNGPTPKWRVMELAKEAGYTEGAIGSGATKLNLTFRRESEERMGLVWALSDPNEFPDEDDSIKIERATDRGEER
jgi:hypothetical protein